MIWKKNKLILFSPILLSPFLLSSITSCNNEREWKRIQAKISQAANFFGNKNFVIKTKWNIEKNFYNDFEENKDIFNSFKLVWINESKIQDYENNLKDKFLLQPIFYSNNMIFAIQIPTYFLKNFVNESNENLNDKTIYEKELSLLLQQPLRNVDIYESGFNKEIILSNFRSNIKNLKTKKNQYFNFLKIKIAFEKNNKISGFLLEGINLFQLFLTEIEYFS
ncbi:hypothetical protein [Metamycoplasma equirhinis]|uniref:hypothetical protein n=2 Tax=Metamycoplasma equirhinis TaxID=92402 RepID=UPI0035943372